MLRDALFRSQGTTLPRTAVWAGGRHKLETCVPWRRSGYGVFGRERKINAGAFGWDSNGDAPIWGWNQGGGDAPIWGWN